MDFEVENEWKKELPCIQPTSKENKKPLNV
jgi:hypothetical protein